MAEDPRLEQLLDELLNSPATPEEVCASCPELLPQLRARWRKVGLLRAELDALFPTPARPGATPPTGTALPQVPGYEVQELLGRGGMGVVYRAWHLRLHRPVALKMLLAGAHADAVDRERFQREAEAVAALGHPNIVQVFDVGDVDGRPYFTMELIEGGDLAEHIRGVPQPARQAAALVATLADAMHAAHQGGIVHRDLKPANILLTGDGTPKVSDFGLARRLEGEGGLTLSGVLVGTPSYMAPEQARADKGATGPATDVYALGAILYELLTGRPPFHADSAAATLQQVLADEPVPPARLNPRVPRDLETICLKCLNKEPPLRYASAQALADDLRRFECGEPIAARPLGRLRRLARWARRRPAAAALSGVLVVTAALALALVGGWLWLDGQRRATTRAVARAADDDLREADRLTRQGDLTRARAALERANGRLGGGGAPDAQQRVRQAEAELQRCEGREEEARQLRMRLDAIRLARCALVNGHFDRLRSDREYEEAFRSAGLNLFKESPQVVADRINDSPARAALVAALDDWAVCAAHKLRRDWLLAVTRLADPDSWRDRVRDPRAYWDLENLEELTRTAPLEGQSVQLLVALGERLHAADAKAALPFLRQVQQAYPDDFFANFWLGFTEEPVTAVGYYRVAQAVRPNAVVANRNLADKLLALGRTEEAIPYLRRVVALDPKDSQCRTLLAKGSAKVAWDHSELARKLQKQQRWAEAITHYRAAVALTPDWASSHYDLGMALNSPGHQDEAIEQLRKTLALDPRYPAARVNLSHILADRGQADEAIAELRQAVALDPRNTGARAQLRAALARLRRWPEVRAAWREELDAGPPEHDAWFGYAELCLFLGAEEDYRRARRDLLAHFGATTDPAVAARTGRACLLLPAPEDELRQAAALAERAVAAGRSGHEWAYPFFLFAKGLADYRLGRYDDAIAVMSGEAARAEYTGPSPRLILAMALHRKEQKDEAVKTLAAAVVSTDWSVAKADRLEHWIAHVLRREAEALILPNLPAFLEGKYEPKDNNERLALVGACQFHGRRAAEAGLLAAAFAADPKLAEGPAEGPAPAPRAAAVAGCGGGADAAALSEPERARWRRQAVAWLRLDLAAWTKRLEAVQTADRAEVQKALARWRENPDLAELRDAHALEKLPPAERQECQALWQEVADLLRRSESAR